MFNINAQSILRRIFHIIKRLVIAIILLFLLTVLIFLIPGVQTYTAKEITKNINETYGTNINIERVRIAINADIKIEEALVLDHQNDTLINIKSLSTSVFNLSHFITKNDLDLSSTEIEGLDFNIIRYQGEESDNLTHFIEKFKTEKPKDSTQVFKLHIDDVFMINSQFSIKNYNKDNPDIFSIKDLNLDLDNINIVDDKISMNINSLEGLTGYGLDIKRLQTKFFMGSNEMRLDQLSLETPNSNIDTNLRFQFEKGDWADFENKVKISAKLDQSLISSTDLNYFYKGFGTSEDLRVSGKLNGMINDFEFTDANINGIQRSRISGDFQFKEVANAERFELKSQYIDITTNYFDLKRLLPNVLGDNLPEFIQYMGSFSLEGQVYLKSKDLEADLSLESTVGSGKVNLNFEDLDLSEKVKYSGFLNLKNLNLGKITQSKTLGLSTFKVNINGSGFTQKSLNTKVEGQIKAISINNYVYNNISIDGNLKYPIFDGKLVSLDPNLLFDFEGLVDASKAQKTYKFQSNIKYADLYKLNLIKKDSISIFSGKLDIDIKASSIDDAVGRIKFENFNYQNTYDTYNFEDFELKSEINEGIKQIAVNSPDVINGKIYGDFRLSELPEFIDFSIRNLYFKNIGKQEFLNKNLKFEFQINNQVVEAFFPEIGIAANTFLNGNISSNEDEMKIRFLSPEIRYKENIFSNVEIQLDKQNPFFDTYINIANIENSIYPVANINLINVKLNDTLFFRTEFEGGEDNADKFNLSFYQTYDENENTIVGIQKSDIKFKNKEWIINKDNQYQNNRILLESGLQNFIFDSITMSHKNQILKLNGVMRDSTYKDISLKMRKVELNNITPNLDNLDLRGLVNGDINLFQKKNQYAPNLQVLVNDFKVNDVNYGNLKVSANGNKDLSDFELKAYLYNQQQNYLSAQGMISSNNQKQTIDLDAELNALDISSLSPLGADVINNLRGEISGNAKLFGELQNPDFSGELNLKDAGLKIPYLNVDFGFGEKSIVSLDKKRFVFEDIQLTDTKYKTQGILSGYISHEQFQSWNLDLNLDSDNILTLDTSFDEESLYYGTAFISGNASISGPTDALVIDVTATSQPNTVFNIPLSDTETIGDNSFIYFLSPEDKENKAQGKSYKFDEISGLSLTFDLKITKDALVEVVVDQESGSKLRGRGEGSLLIEINTNGKFDMYGDFVAFSGNYIYKYQGLIEKKFEVIPGGYLSWDGNPVDANMDIKAKYTTTANPAVLLENPSVNREIPIGVIISLSGELMQPDISFDLEYPNLSSIVESELNYRIQGKENKERQALSLVVQGSFYNDEGVGLNALGSNLIAERATSILDQILKDDEGKFNIGFDYVQAERTPTQNAIGSDRVGMTLQTQLSDKIFINGRFGVPVGGQTQSFVFGDVEVNFLLNKSGSLRAQMFNRESNIQFIGEELGYAQGVGILYTVDFETFGELLRKILNKREEVENKKDEDVKEEIKGKNTLVPSYIEFPNEK